MNNYLFYAISLVLIILGAYLIGLAGFIDAFCYRGLGTTKKTAVELTYGAGLLASVSAIAVLVLCFW